MDELVSEMELRSLEQKRIKNRNQDYNRYRDYNQDRDWNRNRDLNRRPKLVFKYTRKKSTAQERKSKLL
jgi:hypothetical protein